MDTLYYDNLQTTMHQYCIVASEAGLVFVGSPECSTTEIVRLFPNTSKAFKFEYNTNKLKPYLLELTAYFKGQRESFDFPIELTYFGTIYQQQVWQALQQIPYGQTSTYTAIANQLRRPNAVRAIANAVGKNPLQIVIPCHRVLRKDGQLGGYRGGIPMKKALLKLEAQGEFDVL